MLCLDPLVLLGWNTLPDSLLSSLFRSLFLGPGVSGVSTEPWPHGWSETILPLQALIHCCLHAPDVCLLMCVLFFFLSMLTGTCGFVSQLHLLSRPEKWQNWSLCLFVTACFVDLNCDSFLLASAVLEIWCNDPAWVSSLLHLSPTDLK